jgi:acyl-CoA thioester hydrolase
MAMITGEHTAAVPRYQHEITLEVRDYECDLQGVVNNAVYLHYLEHARHMWLLSLGLDFVARHHEGIDLVVARLEIDYRSPLRSGDRFVVRSSMRREGRLRLVCRQDICRSVDGTPVAQALVTVTGVQGGRPRIPEELAKIVDALPV